MAIIYLALGSNLGNRQKNIKNAITLLKKNGVAVQKISTIIETEPVGFLDQGKFLNAVLKGTTELSAFDLLAQTKSIEKKLGRIKTVRNGPRTIDIDILLYDQEKILTPRLTIPHPGMWERDFVMGPLKEISPEICRGKRPCAPTVDKLPDKTNL